MLGSNPRRSALGVTVARSRDVYFAFLSCRRRSPRCRPRPRRCVAHPACVTQIGGFPIDPRRLDVRMMRQPTTSRHLTLLDLVPPTATGPWTTVTIAPCFSRSAIGILSQCAHLPSSKPAASVSSESPPWAVPGVTIFLLRGVSRIPRRTHRASLARFPRGCRFPSPCAAVNGTALRYGPAASG